MSRQPGDFGVLIGIQHYPNHSSLQGPHQDVKDVREWLVDDAYGGGLDPDHCVAVLSDGAPGLPVQTEVDAAFEKMLSLAEQGGARRLYVYFSGHGIAGADTQALLCLANWSLARRLNAALDEAAYRKVLRTWGTFEEVVFLADCCRSWMLGVTGLPPQFSKVPPGPAVRELVGRATRDKYPSFEHGIDVVRGHFTRALLEALEGAAGEAGETSPGVRASALKSYVETRTTEIARSFQQDQEAVVDVGLRNDANFGLAPLRVEVDLVVPAGVDEGLSILDPLGSVVAKRAASVPGLWRVTLGRGLHVVRTASGKQAAVVSVRSTLHAVRVELRG